MENIYHCPSARPDATAALTRGAMRIMADMGAATLTEFRLPNGRRADIAALDRSGRLSIIEVKSCRADFDADAKWRDYLLYCDAFYFAVDTAFPQDILPQDEGLIIADAFGGLIRRAGPERNLQSARRKALTLRFARQAASRLSML